MSKKKRRQHFVPITYYSNFYSIETSRCNNSVAGCLTCYRLTDGTIFNDKGKNIANEKFLYEFSDKPIYENYIENRFSKNVETPIGAFLKSLLSKLNKMNIGDIILCDDETYMMHKFIVTQMLRHPLIMPSMFDLLYKFISDASETPIPKTKDVNEELAKLYLESISDLNSDFIVSQAKALMENFYTVILKINGFNLFTSDMPIMLVTDNEDISKLTFYDYDIMMPISPDFCVSLLSKKYAPPELDKTMLPIDKEQEDDFLKAIMSSSDILVSNEMSNITKRKIDSIYPIVLKNREIIKIEQEKARKELGL